MTIKSLLAPNKFAIFLAVVWTLFITYLSLTTSTQQPQTFENEDKIVHFTFYFGFVLLWYRYLVFRNSNLLNNKITLVIISIVFGIAIEFAQKYFTTTRQADIWDVIANSIGSLVGIFVAANIFKTDFKSNRFEK
ncbi:VanZ family protein [Flavobacterium sp.]|uniref:VanZ family protein n=1 Tax=Flavobacterium sp. TaxID=239 RepID=UPI00374D33DD